MDTKGKFEITFEETQQLLQEGKYIEVIDKLSRNFRSKKKYRFYPKGRQTAAQQFSFSNRCRWIKTYRSWALPPTVDQIHELRDIIGNRKILEIGAGCGLWAGLLTCVGCNIIATDLKKESTSEYIDVEPLSSSDALVKYGSEVDGLFVSWGRGHPTQEEFLYFKGDLIITIGEKDGCTSSGCLDDLDDLEWKILKIIDIPQWSGIWDKLIIYQRVL